MLGSGGLEAAIVNTLSPGDRVLAVSIGAFGDRFAKIARTYGADVTKLRRRVGPGRDPAHIARRASRRPGFKAVLVTHNETSTGVMNPLAEIAAAVHEASPDALLLVDGVSGLGGVPFEMDAWGLDVVVTASQKTWMSAPGIAMIAAVGPGLGRPTLRRGCRAPISTSPKPATSPPRARRPSRRRSR